MIPSELKTQSQLEDPYSQGTSNDNRICYFDSKTNNKQNYNFLRVLVYEYSWRRAREDYARRQAWSQLFLGDGKYVVLALLRVDVH